MTSRLTPLLACFLGLLGTGCAGQALTVVRPPIFDSDYGRGSAGYLARYGSVPTVVVGNPFSVPDAQLADAVAAAMAGSYFGPELDFTPAPLDIEASYKVVVVFDPAPHARADRACRNPDQPRVAPGQGTSVLMVICASDRRASSNIGYHGAVSGPDDPALARLLRHTLSSLLPPRREDINSRDGQRRS